MGFDVLKHKCPHNRVLSHLEQCNQCVQSRRAEAVAKAGPEENPRKLFSGIDLGWTRSMEQERSNLNALQMVTASQDMTRLMSMSPSQVVAEHERKPMTIAEKHEALDIWRRPPPRHTHSLAICCECTSCAEIRRKAGVDRIVDDSRKRSWSDAELAIAIEKNDRLHQGR